MKRAPLALTAALLSSTALAQTPPATAQMGIDHLSTPEVLQALDSTKHWVPLGTMLGGTFTVAGPEISLRSFGAKCDGSDDTAALQAWLASAHAQSKLTGMPGNCAFKSALLIPTVDDLIVDFQGAKLRYQGTNTTNDILSIGSAASDCTPGHRVLIQNFSMVSDTVMTAGAAFRANRMCDFRLNNAYIGNVWLQPINFYNGCHFWGGNTIYVTNYSCSGSNIGEIDNGVDTANGGLQATDIFHYNGAITKSNVGLNIAGNCGGCQWDAVDVVANHTNVLIDQSQTPGKQNVQIMFGPLFASDGTNGAPNVGVRISDPGNTACGTGPGRCNELMCNGCWISTTSGDCLVIDAGVNWAIRLDGIRMRNCGSHGIVNNSANIHLHINGGVIAQNGAAGILNTATLPWVQILSPPAMYGQSSDIVGLTPTVVSGCGGGDAVVNPDDDYGFSVVWGSTPSQTTCTIAFGAYHVRSPTYTGAFIRGSVPNSMSVSAVTATGETLNFATAPVPTSAVRVMNSGVGF